MNADRERETVKKTLDILEKTTGKRPAGWVTPIYGWSENTIDYLAEAKLAWCSDALDASVPYLHQSKNGKIVMIPWSEFVDNRALRASPRIFFDVYKDMFDYLHACEPGGLIKSACTAISADVRPWQRCSANSWNICAATRGSGSPTTARWRNGSPNRDSGTPRTLRGLRSVQTPTRRFYFFSP